MAKSEAEKAYEAAKKKLAEMRVLRHQGKFGEELIELRKLLKEIFEVYEPWSDIIHGDIIHEQGVVHQNLRDYPLALDCLWSAAKLRSRLYYPIDLFYTLHQIVMCKLARGDAVMDISEDIVRVREIYESAHDYAVAIEDFQACGYTTHNFAFYYQIEELYDAALLYYSISEEFMKKAKDSRGLALSCLRQAQCYRESYEYSQALGCLDEAEKIFRELGDEKRLVEVQETRKAVKKLEEMIK